MKTMLGRRVGSAANEPQRHRGHSEKNTEKTNRHLLCALFAVRLWFVFMRLPSLHFAGRQQEFDDVREVLFAYLLLKLVGHERLAGGLERLDLRAEDRVLGVFGAAEGDARGRLSGEEAG